MSSKICMLSMVACRVFGQMINEAAALILEALAERRVGRPGFGVGVGVLLTSVRPLEAT